MNSIKPQKNGNERDKKRTSLWRSIRRSGLLVSVVFFVMTLAVFGPIELFYTNGSELWFSFFDLLSIVAILTVVLFVVPLGIGSVLPKKARSLFACLLFAVTLALYIQGNYANINYGILDGRDIDWNGYPIYAAIDTAGWIAVVGGMVLLWHKRRRLFHKVQKYVSLFVIAMQVLTLGILTLSGDVLEEDKPEYYLSNQGIYEVSAKDNVIIFVLDAFDEQYFLELLEEEPEKYSKQFEGFTHFSNASVGGASTKVGVPAIISGESYPGKITYPEYIKEAFDSDGLYSALSNKGYTAGIYTESAFVPENAGRYIANQVSSGYKVSSYSGLAQKYMSLTCYKYMPHVLKKYFWIYTGDFDVYRTGSAEESYQLDDALFYNNLKMNGLAINQDQSVFKLIHLNGAHPPYCINEYAQPVSPEDTSTMQQAKGSLYIVEEYISQMKALGAFESSMIIVMADHGREDPAHGILLVKNRMAEDGLNEISAPVSYFDLHNTIFDYLGTPKKGYTFNNVPENAERERLFYNNATEGGNMRVVEYRICGHMDTPGTRIATGRVLSPDVGLSEYHLGTTLTFGMENTAIPYIKKGVNSIDMRKYSWTDGHEVEFEFVFDKEIKNDLIVSIDIMSIYGKIGPQHVRIMANGGFCHEEKLEDGKVMSFDIPYDVIDGRKLNLKMELPDAVSPRKVFGEGHDSRELALALRGLTIVEQREKTSEEFYQIGTPISFGKERTAAPYVKSGIDLTDENTYSWSDGSEVELWFNLEKEPETDLNVTIDVMTIYGEMGPQNIKALINGVLCHEETLESDKLISFVIPKTMIQGKRLHLRMELPNAVCPADIFGEGYDRRTLALAIKELTISELGGNNNN